MLMIRMARFGAKKKPTYRVVVIDKERARNSRSVEVVGTIQSRQPAAGRQSEPRAYRVLDEERRAAIRHRQPAFEEPSRAGSQLAQ